MSLLLRCFSERYIHSDEEENRKAKKYSNFSSFSFHSLLKRVPTWRFFSPPFILTWMAWTYRLELCCRWCHWASMSRRRAFEKHHWWGLSSWQESTEHVSVPGVQRVKLTWFYYFIFLGWTLFRFFSLDLLGLSFLLD